MPDFYSIGAQRGRIVGQGLMNIGQGISAGRERYERRQASEERAKLEAEERKERKKARQFTQTVSVLDMTSKMIEGLDLPPEQKQKIVTGVLLPKLAKIGALDEVAKEDVSKLIALFTVQNDDDRKGFSEDLVHTAGLIAEGKTKEAKTFFYETVIPQYTSKYEKSKPIFDFLKDALKSEIEYSRKQEEKETERTEKGIEKGVERVREKVEKKEERRQDIEDTIAGWKATGKVKEITETGLLAGEKGTAFEYEGRKLLRSEEEKKREGKPFEFKSSDSNTIGRQVGQLFGGRYEPITGQFRGLDKEIAQKALAVQSRAEKIYFDKAGQITHGEAAKQAAKEYGIEIPLAKESWKEYR